MPYKILLVEDDESFAEEFVDCLDEYNVLHAKTGKDAIAIFKKPHMIDMVILDVGLPDMSGTEVLRHLRASHPGVGIIILTGQGTKEVIVDALKGKADDYMEKPFNVGELKNTIQQILRSKNEKDSTVFSKDTEGKIELAKRFAQSNINKRISLKEVAEELCLSPKYFSRLFKEQTGFGFNEYRLKIKFQEAQSILKDSNLNVGQVAQKFGYQDLKSFTRLFKKYTGNTPSIYRVKLSRVKK